MEPSLQKTLDQLFWSDDRRRLNRLKVLKGSPLPKNTERLLRCSTEHFTAGALWKRTSGAWSCSHAAPILHWMIGMTASQAKLALLKMGASWQWLTTASTQPSAETLIGTGVAGFKGHRNTAHDILTRGTLAGARGVGGPPESERPLAGVTAGPVSLQTGHPNRPLAPTTGVPTGTATLIN